MKFVNCTPHSITFMGRDGALNLIIPVSEYHKPARCEIERWHEYTFDFDGVPISVYATKLGNVENLPIPQPNVGLIVSRVVAEALPYRRDLFIVDDTVRDDKGQIIGCRALAQVCQH